MFSISKKGFTLVELMIVIAIIGVLTASLYPSLTGYIQSARDSTARINIQKIVNRISQRLIISSTDLDTSMSLWQWYCLPLKSTSMQCSNNPKLSIITELYDISSDDFRVWEALGLFPLLMRTSIPNPGYEDLLFANSPWSMARAQYILSWWLPGTSDLPSWSVWETVDYKKANARCKPWSVRWINFMWSNITACQVLIPY
jgi:prepilin-type N-terminal cleavage/methylation domain-containing protein